VGNAPSRLKAPHLVVQHRVGLLGGVGMSVASIGSAVAGAARSATERRISLQTLVVVLLLIEGALFLLSAIAPSFYLKTFGLLTYSNEQFDMLAGRRALAAEKVFGVNAIISSKLTSPATYARSCATEHRRLTAEVGEC
jgi:hypothetical protein